MSRAPATSPRRAAVPLVTFAGDDASPLYVRVYRRIRENILGGSLRPGDRLPSARTLAADLTVSRNTVEAALTQLQAEGFVVRRVGAGTYVATALPDLAAAARGTSRPRGRGAERRGDSRQPLQLSARGQLAAELGGAEELGPERLPDLCAADVDSFPMRIWNRLLARNARRSGSTLLKPSDPAGLRVLREAIADYVTISRGVRCEWPQVLVVSSTQQSIDLTSRLLLDAESSVAFEEPGYPSARAAFQAAGVSLQPIPVNDGGLDTDALRAGPSARLLYVSPSHQFPLGVTMGLARRLAAILWAAETDAWVFEDDYDSEFRYDGRPLAAMQGLDTGGRVLYAGTFNKVLFPGLRLAYLVVPRPLVDAFAARRRLVDGYSPALAQATLADFISEGHFTNHLRQMRARYAERRDVLTEAIATHWGGAVRLGPADTGLHLVAHLPPKADDVRLAHDAAAHGIGVTPLSRYYLRPSPARGLLISYGATTSEGIRTGVRALAPLLAPLR